MQNDRNCEGAHIVPIFLNGASLPLILCIFMILIAFVREGTNSVVLFFSRSDFFIDRASKLCKKLIIIRLLCCVDMCKRGLVRCLHVPKDITRTGKDVHLIIYYRSLDLNIIIRSQRT